MSACEWNPDHDRPSWPNDEPNASAVVSVGAKGEWHLCESCAELPRSRRSRKRTPMRKLRGWPDLSEEQRQTNLDDAIDWFSDQR